MKKLATIIAIAALGGLSAFAQGTVNFGNTSSFTIMISPNSDGSGATKIGGANGGASSLLGGGASQVTISLYVALASAPSQFFLAGTTLNSSSTSSLAAGTFTGGNPYTIPATLDAGAFSAGTTIDYYFTAVGSLGSHGVESQTSATGTGYSLGGGANSPGAMFGSGGGLIPGFTLTPVPEPTTIFLGGLGAAALLLYRRKK